MTIPKLYVDKMLAFRHLELSLSLITLSGLSSFVGPLHKRAPPYIIGAIGTEIIV